MLAIPCQNPSQTMTKLMNPAMNPLTHQVREDCPRTPLFLTSSQHHRAMGISYRNVVPCHRLGTLQISPVKDGVLVVGVWRSCLKIFSSQEGSCSCYAISNFLSRDKKVILDS